MKNSQQTSRILNGNEAVALALKQINPDVFAAYPITPSTHIPEVFSSYVANGVVDTEFVPVESEHSAMSACIGAAASGARAVTATASQGLAYMHEVLWNASGMRLPILLANANRALSAPLSIHGDHSDSMSQRDTGWIQLYADSPQEAYDLTLQAYLIGENAKVRLPVMVCFDGFETSHLSTNVEVMEDKTAKDFVGEVKTLNPLLDLAHPVTYGSYTNPDWFFEIRRSQHEGMQSAQKVISEVGKSFGKISGRDYSEPIETLEIEDAESVIVIVGASSGSVTEAVKKLREKGKKVGMLRVRSFRPFPTEAVANALKKAKKVAACDKTMPAGGVGGPLFTEVSAALLENNLHPQVANFIYGIGQRQFSPTHAEEIFAKLSEKDCERINFVNLRE